MTRKVFDSMDEHSKKFYNYVFNNVLLNIAAVNHGYFDTFLCEVDDEEGIEVSRRWKEAIPQVIMLFRISPHGH